MPVPERAPAEEAEEGDAEGEELDALAAEGDAAIERLEAAGDAATLIALARALRAGSPSIPRDLARCFACYRGAAALGNVDAKYSTGLFLLAGGVVPQDVRAGAAELRAAADGGSVPAKVYVANLYEQGIAYKLDAEKADVWYRSAARAAGIAAEPESPAWTRALADLGSVRHGLAVIADPATSEGDKGALGRKMKAYGWQLRVRDDAPPPSSVVAPSTSTPPPAPVAKKRVSLEKKDLAATPEGAEPEAEAVPDPVAAAKPERSAPRAAPSRFTPKHGLTAFAVAALFVAMGLGAGHLLTHGARELLAAKGAVPLFGERIELVLPAVLGLFGVVPAIVLYKLPTVVRAIVVAALAGVGGYAAFGAPGGVLLATIELQTSAFAVAGFLASLLVLGVLGGARAKNAAPPPTLRIGRPFDA